MSVMLTLEERRSLLAEAEERAELCIRALEDAIRAGSPYIHVHQEALRDAQALVFWQRRAVEEMERAESER